MRERHRWLGCDITWPCLCLVVIAALSSVRMIGGQMLLPDRETGAARWLAAPAAPQATIMAPWYVAIQINRIDANTFFKLPKPYLPGGQPHGRPPERRAWLVLDDREWMFHARDEGAPMSRSAGRLRNAVSWLSRPLARRVYRGRPAVR